MKTKWVSAPYLVWMTVFIAVPLLMIAVFAFTTNDGEFTVKTYRTWVSMRIFSSAPYGCR